MPWWFWPLAALWSIVPISIILMISWVLIEALQARRRRATLERRAEKLTVAWNDYIDVDELVASLNEQRSNPRARG